MALKAVVGRLKLYHIVVLGASCLLTRALVDLAHIPLYLDAPGVFAASMLLGPLHGALAGVVAGVVLSLYYEAYSPMIPFMAVMGLAMGYFYKRGGAHALVGAFLSALVYQVGWLSIYTVFMGVWVEFGIYMTSRGGLGLLADAFTSIFVASILSRLPKAFEGKGGKWVKPVLMALLIASAASLALIGMSRERVLEDRFPRDPKYVFKCTRMDLVWLPMWHKGTNYYYYPLDRFDRAAPGYQVWIGMYWVQGRVPLSVETIAFFAIWDQNAWLRLYGCPRPYTTIAKVENITDVMFKGHSTKLMYGSLYTRSDVGPEYEDVRLDGFFIVFYHEKYDRTCIIYACATEENFGTYLPELWRMVDRFPL